MSLLPSEYLFVKEHHLQRALSAQQVYGTAEALVIPIPEVDAVGERYAKLYGSKGDFRVSKQYIHVQRMYYVGFSFYVFFVHCEWSLFLLVAAFYSACWYCI